MTESNYVVRLMEGIDTQNMLDEDTQDPDADTDAEDTVLPGDVNLWTTEHVKLWLIKEGFEEEVGKFEAQNITGKSILLLEKSDLKDMDIVMGKRLELYEKIKALHPKNLQVVDQEAHSNKENSNESTVLWKTKISKIDRNSMNPKQKAMYLSKIAILNKEAASLWPGNNKIHIKGNSGNLAKMEEFLTQKVPVCSTSEIGFGREAIKHHLLQWFHEKNRKIEDGYNYEIPHTPAKRAKRSGHYEESTSSSCSDTWSTDSVQGSETEGDCDDEPSDDIADMSLKSARCIMLAMFKVLSLQHLTVRNHLLPLGKVLKVKCRSQGKYEMVIPLARALIEAHHVEIELDGTINYKNILRKQVKVVTAIDELL